MEEEEEVTDGSELSDALPGGPIASRPLRFYWVLDVSGSMAGEKIGQLNHAIREALPAMQEAAREQAHARVEVRVLTFGSGVKWVTPASIPVEQFTWTDVEVRGVTDMGAAMKAMADEFKNNFPDRSLPPVVVLVTDGQPTDDFDGGLREFMAQPWGKRCVRIGIAIGKSADKDVVRKFIDHPEIEPLEAGNSADLVNFIRWVSTQVVQAASSPASQPPDAQSPATAQDMLPPPPASAPSPEDVW